jgi:pimeloyl-ACP methyl ester carboxylesterase
MPFATTNDGVRLHYEETGAGTAIVFAHEFAGDHRSWEPQLRHFGKRHRCVAFNARGYPPSDVPDAASAYSQARAADDIASVLDHLGLAKAHIVGLSWEDLRHCILAFATRTARFRCASAAAAMARPLRNASASALRPKS